MKNILKICLLLAFFLLINPDLVSAHPMDVTYTEFYLTEDNHIKTETYISWAQALLLTSEKDSDYNSYSKTGGIFIDYVNRTLLKNQKNISKYLEKNILILNNGNICSFRMMPVHNQDNMAILFGRGVNFTGEYECSSQLGMIDITNSIFVDKFDKQTNNTKVYAADNKIIQETALNTKNTRLKVDLIPKTPTQAVLVNQKYNNIGSLFSISKNNLSNNLNGPILTTCLIVFTLGLLHTLEAGHSKNILISFMLDRQVKLSQGIMYSFCYTLTHLSDIFALSILFLLVNSFVDLYTKLPYLQKVSSWLLLITALIILLKNIRTIIVKNSHEYHYHEHPHNHYHNDTKSVNLKEQLVLGFITGLAPCLFGWSIFLVILTTRKVWAIFPVIISFGLGIFCALAVFTFLVAKFKSIFYRRLSQVEKWSPIISSVLLVGFALKMVLF